MNLDPPPPPQLPHPRFCPRHPDEHFTGFCASCLRERLAGLDPALANPSSSIRVICTGDRTKAVASSSSRGSDLLPDLRRCKSYSGGRGERTSRGLEPKRKSCDVRVRNTLWGLFNLEDERKGVVGKGVWGNADLETQTRDQLGITDPVIELREEEEEEAIEIENGTREIRVLSDVSRIVGDRITEIEAEEESVGEEELKTMKEHIDLEIQDKKPQGRDLKEIAGSVWGAASLFSKKLQKWRRKQQKRKKHAGRRDSSTTPKKKRLGRQTQSEVADYGFGRRSCDTDPRFSLDAGRVSFDDPRYSWDEPRASWDGHLVGRMFPRLHPMDSVVEDVSGPVTRSDNQIPVEEPMTSIIEDEMIPGGSVQTRDYYSEDSSSQRRRRSLDRSSSIGQTVASMVAEPDEMKSVSNAKVTPATSDYFHGAKVLVTDCDLGDSMSNSLKDNSSESFESAFRDAASVVRGNCTNSKKSRGWSKGWSIWGLIHRRSGRKNIDEETYPRGNVVPRSLSESWPELRREANGKTNGSLNRTDFRRTSSVSSRRSSNIVGLLKRREDIGLERNQSARYSPSNIDNGLLRFYLTPLRGNRKSSSGKGRLKSSHSRSALHLY